MIKLKIDDVEVLREELESIYKEKEREKILIWHLELTKHICEKSKYQFSENDNILHAISKYELWLDSKCQIKELKIECEKLKKVIKKEKNILTQSILYAIYYSLSNCYKPKNALLATDYSIKVINIMYKDNKQEIINERIWQINKLRNI